MHVYAMYFYVLITSIDKTMPLKKVRLKLLYIALFPSLKQQYGSSLQGRCRIISVISLRFLQQHHFGTLVYYSLYFTLQQSKCLYTFSLDNEMNTLPMTSGATLQIYLLLAVGLHLFQRLEIKW